MGSVEYVVRDAAGSVQKGTFPGGDPSTIYVSYSKDVSLNLAPATVAGYERSGDDLLVILQDGQVLVLSGFFDEASSGDKSLFLSANGEIVEVLIGDGQDGSVFAGYDAHNVSGKWSEYDQLVFLDLGRVEPVVAPLAGPVLGGLGTLLGGGAAVAGGLLLTGGGDDDDPSGPIQPTVDDPDSTLLIGGTGPDTAVISGTGAPGSEVTVTVGGQSQTVIVDDNGIWITTFDPADLPDDGIYEPQVYVIDPDGNTFELTGPTVDIDTTAPEVDVTAGTKSTGDLLNAAEHQDGATLTGTGEPGASVDVTVNGTTHSTVVGADGNWAVTFATGEIEFGEYETEVSITTTDARGNSRTSSDILVVDTVAPVAQLDMVEGDNIINLAEASDGVTLSGTGEVGATVTVEFQGLTRTTTVGANGTWSLDWAAAEITGGTYDSPIVITSTDAAGNSSTTSHSVHVDTEQDLTLKGDFAINGDEQAAGVTFNGQAEPGSTVVVTLGAVSHSVVAGADGSWSVDFAPAEIPVGTYQTSVQVQATDLNGNVESTSQLVVVDTETVVALDATQAGDNVIDAGEQAAGVTLTGTAEPGSTVQVTLQGVTRTVSARDDGTWSATFASGEIPTGEYDAPVTVTSTDAMGNSASTSGTVRVDTQTGVTLDATQAGDNVVNAAEAAGGVSLTGTAEPGASVTVVMSGVSHTVTADGAGNWTALFAAGEIPPGEYDAPVTVTSIDAVGNSATTSGTVHVDTVTDVTINPGHAGGDGVINAAEAGAGVTFTGQAEPGATVLVTVAGVTRTASVAADGSWTAIYGAGTLPQGEFDTTVSVQSTDAAGNTDTASSAIRIDTNAGDVALSPLPIEIDDVINAAERADGVVLNGTATPGLTVTVTLGAASQQVVADAAGNWSVLVPATSIPQGVATLPISASITDSAGNSKTVTDSVQLDTFVDNFSHNGGFIEGDNVVNANEHSDGVLLTGTVEPGSTVMVQLGNVTQAASVDAAGNWQVNFASGAIPQGTYQAGIVVTATDAAGNTDTLTDTVSIDTEAHLTVAPDQTADDVINAAEQDAGVTLTGTAEPGSVVMVEMLGVTRAAAVDGSGNWTASFTEAELPEGTYTATATITATDPAGNVTSVSESFGVDTEVDTPDVDSVTFVGQDVGRIGTLDVTDSYTVNTLESNGTVDTPSATVTTHPVFGTEYTFDQSVPDGTNLVVSRSDDAGNTSSTLVVLEDGAGNATTVGHAGLAGFDIDALNLDYGDSTSLVLTEAQIRAMSDNSDTLTIHGGSDDSVTISGATNTGETRQIDGNTYNVYTLGNDGATLVVEQDITVII